MKYMILITAIALAGCGKPMSFEEAKARIKYCTERGLEAQSVSLGIYHISKIRCVDVYNHIIYESEYKE